MIADLFGICGNLRRICGISVHYLLMLPATPEIGRRLH